MNLDMFKAFDYEPHEADEEVILSELPLSLITGSIKEQFENPVMYKKNDFVQSFETRWLITKENMTDEDEDDVWALFRYFVSFMRDIFREKLSTGLPYLEDMPEDEQLELIHYIYRFFVMNIKKNYFTFIYNYIQKHKKELAETLGPKKDVTTISLKDAVTDEEDLIIIASLSQCIKKLIMQNDSVTVDEFLELSRGDEPNLENEFINDKYDDFNINGNFVMKYNQMVDEETLVEIECRVRNKILSKYRK